MYVVLRENCGKSLKAGCTIVLEGRTNYIRRPEILSFLKPRVGGSDYWYTTAWNWG